ncbi:MAG: 30S ribosomal protein S15 [Halobacteriales archaeon]|nr:30S ribosomal protein S15 [Halobacteriales archaeon]
MARMHTRRRGSSASDKPITDEPPEWSADDADAVEERVVELAEQGLTQAEIGIELRDNGVKGEPVPDVKLVTGKKISEILEENDAEPEYPEDLISLMEKAIRVRDHMDENNTDASNKRAYQNVESKIRRLVNYYRGDELPDDFKYSPETARRIIE